MKFTCNQQKLTKALNVVSKAVTTRTTYPILKGILLKVDNQGYLSMSSSDLDITIEETLEVENFEAGSIVVMSKLFGDIIRKLPNADINFELVNDTVNINCMNSNFSIVGIDADEFPTINNDIDESSYIEIEKNILKSMINKTAFAASIDESKGVITGLLIELSNTQINMIAIDGYRMAITREAMFNKDEKSVIISAKILNEVAKIINESDDNSKDLKIIINSNKAIFVMDNIKVILKIMDGEFIKYNDVLPKNNNIEVKVRKSDLNNSIERASLLSNDGKNNLIRMDIKDTIMTITSKSEEGAVREEVIINKTGDDIEIGFNAKYVLDVLKCIDDEELIMKLNTPVTPCLIEPVEGTKFQYLVLPVRLTNN